MNEKLKKALGLDRPRRTLLILCCLAGVHFAFPRYIVQTGSMIPTIPPGSWVIAWNNSILPLRIGPNDVPVFKPVAGISPVPWMHRIVAGSGEKITPPSRSGRVDISPGTGALQWDGPPAPLVVPEAFFYQSRDSPTSYHGLVPENLVMGKVLFHFRLPWRKNETR